MTYAAESNEQQPIPNYPSDSVAFPKVVLLWSSLSSNSHQSSAQKKMNDLFAGKKMRIEQLDGSQTDNKENRNKFFDISTVRGKYPQIFIMSDADTISYVGMDDKITMLLDSEDFDAKFKTCL